jgi:hypothetical protein|eukprot:COSAG06_NODE_10962_length_1590_cov_1.460765_4_plen_164_part_01
MSSLFKISNDMQLIVNELIANGGELTDELQDQLQITESQMKQKASGYAQVIRAMKYDNDVVDAEIKRLQAIKKVRKNTTERLENALSDAMQQFEMDVIETPTTKISFRSSQSVEITDENAIDKQFKTQIITTKIDKMEIKRAIKGGATVDGAELITNKNLQIK